MKTLFLIVWAAAVLFGGATINAEPSNSSTTAEAVCVKNVVVAVKFRAAAPGYYLIPIDPKRCPVPGVPV